MDSKTIKALKLCFDKAPEEAIEYLKSQGFKITWDWKAQLETIKQHCFTVSKAISADMLQDFHDELTKAMAEGKVYKEFKDSMEEVLDNKGWSVRADGSAWRLDTIYRTNMQSAYMAGRFHQMKEVEEDFPYWQYSAVMDMRTRPSHAALNGKVLKSNDPFWKTSYAPNGYNCRCRIKALDADMVKEKKLKVVTGKSLNYEPDEGFNNNPADGWEPETTKYEPKIRKQLEKALK